MRLGVGLEPPHLDPTAGAAAAIDEVVYANVFEGLTRVTADGSVAPALARAWERSEDGRAYVFHLFEGARFHDGAPCTADDVVFSLERARADGSTNAQKEVFAPIESVAALDAKTVRVRLSRPVSDFAANMAWGDAVIVSPASAAANKTHPIGTGPFRFDHWARGAMISLVRNTDYWGPAPALQGAQFLFIPDASAAYAALLSGDVDGFPDFPAPELLPQIRRDARFKVQIGVSEGETLLAINNARPPFNDLRVRRALNHAIDRTAVIQGATFGLGTPIGSHFAPSHPAYVDLAGAYPYDPARARALLREAGLTQGFETAITLPPTGYARRGGEIIAANFRAVGVEARLENMEWAQWLEQVFANKNYDLTLISHTEPMDIGIYARDDYYFNYRDPAFNALIAAADSAPTDAARTAALQAAQRKLSADAVNVFLFQLPKVGVWRSDLTGMWVNAPAQANDLTAMAWSAA